MGEIKSTLDLVMEKTRHLTLSAEERHEQALSDLRKSLKGMIQKYLDGMIGLERFREEWTSAVSDSGIDDRGILFDLVAERVGPDGENQQLLYLLKEIYGLDVGPLTRMLNRYRDEVQAGSELRRKELKVELLENKGISGTAVLPNLGGDDVWTARKEVLRSEFEERVSKELQDLRKAATA